MEYKMKTAEPKKSKEEEVVKIVDQFHKGVLDVNAPAFMPRPNSEHKDKALELDEVVEIITKDY
jgi:hypothetical protein